MQIVIDFDETKGNSRVLILRKRQILLALLGIIVLLGVIAYFASYQVARYWVTSGNEKSAAFVSALVRETDKENRQLWEAGVGSLQNDIADFNSRLIVLNRRGLVIAENLGLVDDESTFDVDMQTLCTATENNEEAELIDGQLTLGVLAKQSVVLEELEAKYDLLSDQSQQYSALRETIPMVRPVLGKNWLASRYGYRRDPFSGRKAFHSGYDYAARTGTPVISAATGVVIYAGRRGNYGKVIEVYHGHGVSSLYGHLSEYDVNLWQYVRRGEVIGKVGSTGRSTGPHLHYELRINNRPRPVQKAINELHQSRRVS